MHIGPYSTFANTGYYQNRLNPSTNVIFTIGQHTIVAGGGYSYTQLNIENNRNGIIQTDIDQPDQFPRRIRENFGCPGDDRQRTQPCQSLLSDQRRRGLRAGQVAGDVEPEHYRRRSLGLSRRHDRRSMATSSTSIRTPITSPGPTREWAAAASPSSTDWPGGSGEQSNRSDTGHERLHPGWPAVGLSRRGSASPGRRSETMGPSSFVAAQASITTVESCSATCRPRREAVSAGHLASPRSRRWWPQLREQANKTLENPLGTAGVLSPKTTPPAPGVNPALTQQAALQNQLNYMTRTVTVNKSNHPGLRRSGKS